MSALEFMGAHPVLTFFLALIAATMVVNVVQALCGDKTE